MSAAETALVDAALAVLEHVGPLDIRVPRNVAYHVALEDAMWAAARAVRDERRATRAALEALADRNNPICDRCDHPITDEPHDVHVGGDTLWYHPDCCPECAEEPSNG